MQKNIIITLLFSILIALFAVLNAAAVPVNLIFTKVDVSAALVILISASIGAIIVYSLDAVPKMKSRKKCRELEKSNSTLTNENTQLKEKNAQLELEIGKYKNEIEKLNEKEKSYVVEEK